MAYLVIASETQPAVIHVRNGWASFVTSCYHELFVDDLKDAIPSQDRRYNGNTKTWSVRTRYLGTLEALVREYWGEPEVREA